ncbi:MAG: hypothetical protein KAJ19_10900, partial [Gammaproteobacteria bacterium]|nr:hypothetical protein [Gammaproteobacteria bacterium]
MAENVEASSDQVGTYVGTSADGFVRDTDVTYLTAWNAATGTVYDTQNYVMIGQDIYTGTYYIFRAFFYFETDGIPDGANISSAVISLTTKSAPPDDMVMVAQSGQPTYPHNPLVVGDYDKTHYSGSYNNEVNTAMGVDSKFYIPLDPDWINVTGLTKICVRFDDEIRGLPPALLEYFQVHSVTAATADYRPMLTVTWDANYTFFGDPDGVDDGSVGKVSAVSYNDAWSPTSGTLDVDRDVFSIGQERTIPNWEVHRGFIYFNTSTLDTNDTIEDAILLVYIEVIANDRDFTVYVQSGMPTNPHVPLEASDYNKGVYYGGLGGGNLANTSALSALEWWEIPLNTSYIKKDGWTKLCLRSDWDIFGVVNPGATDDDSLNLYGWEFPEFGVRLLINATAASEPEPEPEP